MGKKSRAFLSSFLTPCVRRIRLPCEYSGRGFELCASWGSPKWKSFWYDGPCHPPHCRRILATKDTRLFRGQRVTRSEKLGLREVLKRLTYCLPNRYFVTALLLSWLGQFNKNCSLLYNWSFAFLFFTFICRWKEKM